MVQAAADTSDLEIGLVAERGILEKQAILLCRSLRVFGGRYADAPITVFSPRADRRPSPKTLSEFKSLNVNYEPLNIQSILPAYPSLLRMYCSAQMEELSSSKQLLVLDSDIVFARAPRLELFHSDMAARPVDVKGLCTTGAGDGCDGFWRQLCSLVGVDYDVLPLVETTVDRVSVKASYNGGFVLTRRDARIFTRALSYLCTLVKAGQAPRSPDGEQVRAGHGVVSKEGSRWWGSGQACLSLAAWGAQLDVSLLPSCHNFPLNLWSEMSDEQRGIELTAIHYHHLLFEEDIRDSPLLSGEANVSPYFSHWLRQQLLELNDSALAAEALRPPNTRKKLIPFIS